VGDFNPDGKLDAMAGDPLFAGSGKRDDSMRGTGPPARRVSSGQSALHLQVSGARRNDMTSSTTDKVEGKAHELKGAVKERVGQVTNNPNLEVEGTDEKTGGQIQKKVGDIKKVFNK